MPGHYERIPLRAVDGEDRTFEIRSFAPEDRLRAALERVGLLVAPWVLARADRRYTVIDGFKRLRWARESGHEAVVCRVVPTGADPTELLLQRIEERLCGAPLNPAEKAQIVSKLAETLPPERLAAQCHLLLGLRGGEVERWRRLTASGEDILQSAAQGDVAERTALLLAEWERGPSEVACALIRDLRCSASIQLELLFRIEEIALRDGRAKEELLCDPAVLAIREDPQSNHRQKTQALRELLTRWRLPRLSAREERFARELAHAGLPSSIRLMHPPAFEGEAWQLQIGFTRPEELASRLEDAKAFARSPGLARIMTPGSSDDPSHA